MTPRIVSKGLVAIYWVALPLLSLGFIGSGLMIAQAAAPPTLPQLAGVAGSGAVAALIVWRLFLHRRALAASRPVSKAEIAAFSEPSGPAEGG